jgi:hypothetical protein
MTIGPWAGCFGIRVSFKWDEYMKVGQDFTTANDEEWGL